MNKHSKQVNNYINYLDEIGIQVEPNKQIFELSKIPITNLDSKVSKKLHKKISSLRQKTRLDKLLQIKNP